MQNNPNSEKSESQSEPPAGRWSHHVEPIGRPGRGYVTDLPKES